MRSNGRICLALWINCEFTPKWEGAAHIVEVASFNYNHQEGGNKKGQPYICEWAEPLDINVIERAYIVRVIFALWTTLSSFICTQPFLLLLPPPFLTMAKMSVNVERQCTTQGAGWLGCRSFSGSWDLHDINHALTVYFTARTKFIHQKHNGCHWYSDIVRVFLAIFKRLFYK